jgi:hypothetical protein
MKRPRHGIQSTRPKTALVSLTLPIVPPPEWLPLPDDFMPPAIPGPNVIGDDCNESITNVFCFGAFADRHSGVVYNNLTGNFPLVSFDGSIYFLIMYHYEANAILATPVAGLDNLSIFNAFKLNFEQLVQKGFKPKLKVMDNQAMKHIMLSQTASSCT